VTATAEPAQRTDAKPTIVLVHGAFADGSSWNRVIERLQHQGYSVIAPAVPLRGLAADSAYLASVVNQLDGPVLLVGHSYAGALITNAASDAAHVVGLVFVAAFAPDTDERLGDVAATSKDSLLGTAQVEREYPTGPGGETAPEFLVDPARFREVFAADLPAEQAAVLAATQRPVAAAAFSDVSGPPAWKTLPSWAVVATADKAAGTDLVRSMAQRAGAEIVEVDASHVVMVSQPQAVTELILKALHAVS
jgi:pimeloyl-ACP methyl ester carboxylesterase